MSLDGPRTSVFTFQSAVHSLHVLQSLDEQRKKDVLCDVTVLVENNRSFRAHCSVLASCSDFFHTRVINHTSQNLVITLPDEVTVEGFEPLLQFAYTARLHFTKENLLEIHRCAEFLGFHNLDKACFEFLTPKFFDNSSTIQEVKRKGNSKSRSCNERPSRDGPEHNTDKQQLADTELQNAGQEMGTDGEQCLSVTKPSVESPEVCCPASLEKDVPLDFPSLCTKSLTFHMASGHDHFCLQNCGPELLPSSSGVSGELCPFLFPHANDGEKDDVNTANEGSGTDVLEMERVCSQIEVAVDACNLPSPQPVSEDLNVPAIAGAGFASPVGTLVVPTDYSQLCPLNSLEAGEVLESIEAEGTLVLASTGQTLPDLAPKEGSAERSSVEREVAEHLAKGFWPDLSTPMPESLPLDSMDQSTPGNAADFHWLKHLDLTAATGDCPFLRDLGSSEGQTPGGDSLSQSEKSAYMSPINSGEDSDSDTEGDEDSEVTSERAREVQLPFPVEQISTMSRSAFQQMLRQQLLTQEQLDFVQEVRRRSKNRVAAQRCRKRKLDCIQKLECEIKKLRSQKENLVQERSQLRRNVGETLQSLSGLCRSVCGEAVPEPDQLQLLAKYLSPDCPPSVLLTPLASPIIAAQEWDAPVDVSIDACPTEESSVGETLTSCHQPESTELTQSQETVDSAVTEHSRP